MFFFIIIIIAILVSYLEKSQKGLIISLSLFFILFGFQFEMTQDWNVNLSRWIRCTKNFNSNSEEIEYISALFMKLSEPIGFFGWSIFLQLSLFVILFLYNRSFILPQYYYLFLFFLIFEFRIGLTFINSQRQTLAEIFVLISYYLILTDTFLKGRNNLKYLISTLFIICAYNCHGSALVSIGLLGVPFLANLKITGMSKLYTMLIVNALYLSRFFVSLEDTFGELSVMGFLSVKEQFDTYLIEQQEYVESMSFGFLYDGSRLLLINIVLYYYDKLGKVARCMFWPALLSIIMIPFLHATLQRIVFYYYMYIMFFIPSMYKDLKEQLKNIRAVYLLKFSLVFFSCSVIQQFCHQVTTSFCFDRWLDYKSIFSTSWM